MHAVVVTTTTAASAGTVEPGAEAEEDGAARKVKSETKNPFASTGSPRPRKTAARLAGVASSGPSVPNERSFAIDIAMP